MKKLFLTALILNLALPVFAVELKDVTMPKPPAYRTGLSEIPEKEYMEAKAEDKVRQEYVKKDAEQFDATDLTFADLSKPQEEAYLPGVGDGAIIDDFKAFKKEKKVLFAKDIVKVK